MRPRLAVLCGDADWFIRYLNEHSEEVIREYRPTIAQVLGEEPPPDFSLAGIRIIETQVMGPTEWRLVPDGSHVGIQPMRVVPPQPQAPG